VTLRRRTLLLVLAPPFAATAAAAAAEGAPWPEGGGYRTQDYRAPTPLTVPGGRMVSTEEARALLGRRDVVWVDMLPAPRRPEGLAPGSLWRPSPRLGIPGSVWLPEAGRGVLPPETEAWFRDSLARATGGDLGRPVVFYCLADCWMSWNAAKRAAAWGYREVLWYRDGTDGWEAAGLPTEVLHPAPGGP
jgi:PQQ-dependent catabolism-associated CXXCW motif protein